MPRLGNLACEWRPRGMQQKQVQILEEETQTINCKWLITSMVHLSPSIIQQQTNYILLPRMNFKTVRNFW